MRSSEIRERFLQFFKERNHRILPSSSLIPDDPSLLLTGAGMVQFKPIFQGKKQVDFSRAATIQKCVRTTDIDMVGLTARHLTFFEMLGNFSFGDYYKKQAIPWAWELLTEHFKIEPTPLWVTIYKDDYESGEIWNRDVGISTDRIVKLGEQDNFWSAGPTGPCGPCSEIIFDFGEDKSCGPDCRVGCDCDRYLEVWNLVFMQYDRDESGKLNPLPRKNIDTGMGLERTAAILQGVNSAFECDLLFPLVNEIANIAAITYGQKKKQDQSVKIIADHIRATAFLISDGVLPSNEGRGYILRRLIRRAVRHGRLLGIESAFLALLIDKVIETMEKQYPDLSNQHEFILQIVNSEEQRFSQTLKQGLVILDEEIARLRQKRSEIVPGEVAFRLYDTYGFPIELTYEIAQENSLDVNRQDFEHYMEEQKEKARAAVGSTDFAPTGIYHQIRSRVGTIEFVGYESNVVEAEVVALVKDGKEVNSAAEGQQVEIVINKTPFYGEAGGQVGDKGIIENKTGKIEIEHTQIPVPGLYVHRGKIKKGNLKVGQKVRARINNDRRRRIARNHTATHILHWALRKVLGEHVKQAGSLVEDKRLRFDFTHFSALAESELKRIELLANEKIMENHPVRSYATTFDYARDLGAIALFGEKYGEFVRILEIGDFSRELCGGTHVSNTGEIGIVKIISEASVGANLRRLEALSGIEALKYLLEKEEELNKVAEVLKCKKEDLTKRISNLLNDLKMKERENEALKTKLAKQEIVSLLKETREIDGIRVFINKVEVNDMNSLRSYLDLVRSQLESGVIVLGAKSDNKAMLVAYVTSDLVEKGYHAGHLLETISPLVSGGGGGRPDMAQAGGKEPSGLKDALREAEAQIRKMGKHKDV